MANSSNGSSGFSWFLAGLGLGSLLGVLYAPRAGQETRDELVSTALGSTEYVRQRSRDVQRNAGDYVSRGKQQLNNYTEAGKGQVGDYVSRGKGAVETGRQKINEVYNQGAHAVTEQKEKLSAAVDAGKKAYNETTVPETKEELIPSGNRQSS